MKTGIHPALYDDVGDIFPRLICYYICKYNQISLYKRLFCPHTVFDSVSLWSITWLCFFLAKCYWVFYSLWDKKVEYFKCFLYCIFSYMLQHIDVALLFAVSHLLCHLSSTHHLQRRTKILSIHPCYLE